MRCRSLIVIVGFLAFVLAGVPVSAQDTDRSAQPKRRGTMIGTVVGSALGAAAGIAYFYKYHRGACRYGEQDNVWTQCALPMGTLVAGSSVAGYFIGRTADRSARTSVRTPQAASSAEIIAPIPHVRLRSAREPQRWSHLYSQLFIDDALVVR